MDTLKDLIKLFFIVVIPILIFFSPIALSIWKDNYWYLFLFFITWLPSIIFAKIAVFISEV